MQMGVVVKWSVILVVLVSALSAVITASGLHRSPVGPMVFIFLATLFNLVVLFLALRRTAPENAYAAQIMNAGLIGLVAGVLILMTSWILLTVVFPDSLAEMAAGTEEFMRSMAAPEDQIEEAVRSLEETTPFEHALTGSIGTLVTSLVGGALIAIFQRKKG